MTTALTLHLLGPFQAFARDHALTAFATDKARALLVYLALEPDIPHRRESLATLLYPEWSDKEATDNLRRTLYRLRAALNTHDPDLSDTLLTITRTTIQLNAIALNLDAAHFRHTVNQRLARSRLSDSDIEALANVVSRYRGEFVAGLSLADSAPFEEWLLLQRLAFHQQALHVCDVLATAYEQRGQFVRAQQYARQALALEPWREEAHLHLIRLFASNGQKQEALAQFEACRQLLADEMGMEPSNEMQAVVRQIRKGQFHPLPPTVIAAARTRLHRFPTPFTSFVGRDTELQTLVAQLLAPDCRLVTLLGAGGMGKTRLSAQAAQRLAQGPDFTDGLYFVDCAPLSQVEDVPATIAMAVGLVLQGEQAAIDQVQAFLRTKSLLLLLDNMEQVVGCAPDIATLLAACPHVKMLATSREPLQIRAEWRYEVEGLETTGGIESKAAQLFIQRARQVIPAFAPSPAETEAILAIVNRVGGHPLAIELAATWLRFYECATIATEVESGMDFLETTVRDIPARHRSIRVLFDHSWQRLTAAEQKTLRQLSVLRGEWTLAQGTAIANGTPRELANLSDKSLIRRTHAGRYAIDELIRQFALEQLRDEHELHRVQSRCVTFFLEGIARHRTALHGMSPQNAVVALRADWVNIRQAWANAVRFRQWALLEGAVEAYQMFVELTGLVSDGLTDFQGLLDNIGDDPATHRLAAMAHACVAGWFHQRAHYAQAHEHAEVVLALPERADTLRWHGVAWYVRANSHMVQGSETDLIRFYADRAYRCFDSAGDGWGIATVTSLYALAALKQNLLSDALTLYTRALVQFEKLGYPLGIIKMLNRLGVLYRRQDEYHKALTHHLRCLALVEPLNSPAELARHHNNIGAVYRNLHEYDKAIAHFQQAIEADELIGHQRGLAIEKGNLGLIYQEMHRYDEALTYFAESVTIAQAIGLKGVEANFLGCRGELYAELGQFDRARQELERSMEVALAIQSEAIVYTYAGMVAWVYFRLGATERALSAIEEAETAQARLNLREMRAQSLALKAQMLLELGRDVAALQCVEEAITLRTDINGGVTTIALSQLQVLHARLRARLGAAAEAESALTDLLNRATQDEVRADILYGLWEVTRAPRHCHAALSLIERLYATQPRNEYHLRLTALRSGVPASVVE